MQVRITVSPYISRASKAMSGVRDSVSVCVFVCLHDKTKDQTAEN